MLMVADFSDKKVKEKINLLYENLLVRHGNPSLSGQWKFWCKRPKSIEEKERIIIESILTQRANWKNVELAVSRLSQANLLNLRKIADERIEIIESLIKPSGFYRQKAKRLNKIAKFFIEEIGGPERTEKFETKSFRGKLLLIEGIGNETADDILLYAFEREVFVIDEYTRRFVKKHRLSENLSYGFLQKLFESCVKKDYKVYQDYHALIVMEMKG